MSSLATWHQVTCVTTSSVRLDPRSRITHLGGSSPKGRGWRVTLAEAIQGILDGKWVMFVQHEGRRLNLVVASTPQGERYVKAECDHDEPCTLLELPECGF